MHDVIKGRLDPSAESHRGPRESVDGKPSRPQDVDGPASLIALADALHKSEAHLRAIVENEPECVKLVALDGALIEMNAAGLAMIEAPGIDAVKGVCVFNLVAPEDRDTYRAFHARVCAGERGMLEFDMIGLKGTRRRLQAHAVPFPLEPAGTMGLLGITRDITERKRAEDALLLSEERYRRLVEVCPDAIVVGRNERITFINRAGLKLHGVKAPEQVLGKGLFEFIHPDDQQHVRERVWQEPDAEQPGQPVEARLLRLDGTAVDVEIAATSFVDREGPAVFVVAHDISERKQAEEERMKLQAQILHAQKLESLGVLAGGIAHDFNNLLTSMLGYASLARRQLPAESSVIAMLGEIEQAAERAADLSRQMLAYSGKGKFVRKPFALHRLVQEMANLLQTVISKKASLRLELAPTTIEGDATQLRQVVMNLITNASDALGGQAGTIVVRTGLRHLQADQLASPFLQQSLTGGDYAFVEVEDGGCGMTEETLAKIFDPFFTTKFTGRGLGLAAVLGIVRGHGGTIKVATAPDQGTTFQVYLPPAAVSASEPTTAPSDMRWRGSGTILVVDDEKYVSSFASRVLEGAGYKVISACDGREGLALFAQHRQEIAGLVLDMTMPSMDGLEVLRQLGVSAATVPVLLMSGYSKPDALADATGLGVRGFLQKPFRSDDLLAALHDCMRVPVVAVTSNPS